jgi:hypothetical protein
MEVSRTANDFQRRCQILGVLIINVPKCARYEVTGDGLERWVSMAMAVEVHEVALLESICLAGMDAEHSPEQKDLECFHFRIGEQLHCKLQQNFFTARSVALTRSLLLAHSGPRCRIVADLTSSLIGSLQAPKKQKNPQLRPENHTFPSLGLGWWNTTQPRTRVS